MSGRRSGPSIPWPPRETCGPLGELLLDWMWAQRPPLPVTTLAARVGVDRTTLVLWMTTNRQPQPLQLLLLAQVTDLAVAELAAAADVPLERVLNQRAVLFDYVLWDVRHAHTLSDVERATLVTQLADVRNTASVDDKGSPVSAADVNVGARGEEASR